MIWKASILNWIANSSKSVQRQFVCCSAALSLPGCCLNCACASDKAAGDGLTNYCYLSHLTRDTVREGGCSSSGYCISSYDEVKSGKISNYRLLRRYFEFSSACWPYSSTPWDHK